MKYILKKDWGYLRKGTEFEVIGMGEIAYPIKTLPIRSNAALEVRKIDVMKDTFQKVEDE
jgi:hypothetical protein